MSSLDDLDKLFVQSMMNRAIVTKKTAYQIVKHCAELTGFAYEVSSEDFSQLLAQINSKIGLFGMEIKEIRSETNMEEFVVMVNIVDHSNIYERLNHVYSAKEREFFRRILERMVICPESYGVVSQIDGMNMAGTGLRTGELEDLLKRFVSDYWFCITAEGALCPGPRCIAEFEMYFKSNYHEHIEICPLCTNVIFFGASCQVCGKITHKFCIIKYNSGKRARKCACGAEFPTETISEEDVEVANTQPRKKVRKENAGNQRDNHESTPGPSRRASKRHRD